MRGPAALRRDMRLRGGAFLRLRSLALFMGSPSSTGRCRCRHMQHAASFRKSHYRINEIVTTNFFKITYLSPECRSVKYVVLLGHVLLEAL